MRTGSLDRVQDTAGEHMAESVVPDNPLPEQADLRVSSHKTQAFSPPLIILSTFPSFYQLFPNFISFPSFYSPFPSFFPLSPCFYPLSWHRI